MNKGIWINFLKDQFRYNTLLKKQARHKEVGGT